MTLQEYLNQEDPVRMPRVELMPDDYRVGLTLDLFANHTRTQIRIHGIDAEYCLQSDSNNLWTTDEDGNPLRRSCFYIREN